MNEWYSASFLEGMKGMSISRRVIFDRAKKEGWKSRPRKARGGGSEYHISSLPRVTVNQLHKIHLANKKVDLKHVKQCPLLPLRLFVNRVKSWLFNIRIVGRGKL